MFPKFFNSMGKNNKRYIGWSMISNIVSSVQYTICVDNMLCAVDSNTHLYIGKDIIGQLGSLGYMAKMAKNADDNPVKFLTYSHITQQTGMGIVCLGCMTNIDFLYIGGIAGIMNNISFAGFGAINAKCITKLAVNNNIGEIYAKITIINTIASSMGMFLGLSLTYFVPDREIRLCMLPVLGIIRVWAFNKAVKDLL
jgi:hypothetical protein